jgi:hypothetical protein
MLADDHVSIGTRDQTFKFDCSLIIDAAGVGGKRSLATATKVTKECAFRTNTAMSSFIIDQRTEIVRRRVADSAPQRDRSLANLRQHDICRENLTHLRLALQSFDRGKRNDHYTVFGDRTKPCRNISAQFDESEVRTYRRELHSPTNRAGCHQRSWAQLCERPSDERVARIATYRYCAKNKTVV